MKQTLVAFLYAHISFESVPPWQGSAIAGILDQMQMVKKLAFLVVSLLATFLHGSQNLMADFFDDVLTYQVHCRKKTDLVENVQLKERRRLCVHVCVSAEWSDDPSLQDY